jgi:predicted pyridoxine 5'-phosphate oxidase superfamily flavin-nucleotide-binding protein
MATYVPAKRATELIFYMGLVSQSTGQFQANPTLAAGDVKVSKDGGALANLSTLPAVTPAGSKMVKVTLSGAEMTADNVTVVFSDAAGAEWDDCIVNIQTAARQIDDLATSAALATVQADTDDIQTRLPAALSGDGFIKADLLSINDELTSGNNATLNLKKLNVVNNSGDAIVASATGGTGLGFKIFGLIAGLRIAGGSTGASTAVYILGSDPTSHAIQIEDQGVSALDIITTGNGIQIAADGNSIVLDAASGVSILALSDIEVSDGALTLANIANETADQVWEETLADHSGTVGSTAEQLAAAGAAGDPWATAIPGAYGSGTAGKILGDNINATISSRATQTSVDDLPTNAELATALGTADDAVLAQVALVKTETDKIASVKAKTDSLTFTTAGQVDANVQAVNDTELTGDGSAVPWGPA